MQINNGLRGEHEVKRSRKKSQYLWTGKDLGCHMFWPAFFFFFCWSQRWQWPAQTLLGTLAPEPYFGVLTFSPGLLQQPLTYLPAPMLASSHPPHSSTATIQKQLLYFTLLLRTTQWFHVALGCTLKLWLVTRSGQYSKPQDKHGITL